MFKVTVTNLLEKYFKQLQYYTFSNWCYNLIQLLSHVYIDLYISGLYINLYIYYILLYIHLDIKKHHVFLLCNDDLNSTHTYQIKSSLI